MAVRYDNAADRLLRTATVVNHAATYSACGWVYVSSISDNSYNTVLLLSNNIPFGQSGEEIDGIDINRSDIGGTQRTRLNVYVGMAGGYFGEQRGTNDLSTGTWYHVAIVRSSATVLLAYLNGVLEATNTHSSDTHATNSCTRMEFGSAWSIDSDPLNGRTAYWKIWSGAALTAAEVLQEYQSIRPVRTANLWAWLPMFPGSGERGMDYSGFGRTFTEGGTLTDEQEPPVSFGAAPIIIPYIASNDRAGTAAVTAAAPSVSAAGTRTLPVFSGTSGAEPGAPATTATGVSTNHYGAAAPTASAPSTSAQGTHTPPLFSATAAVTAGAPSISSTGVSTNHYGAGTPTPGAPGITATGVSTNHYGTASPTPSAPSTSAQGTHTPPLFSATAATTAGAPATTATGVSTDHYGAATVTPGAPATTATGVSTDHYGQAAVTAGAPSITATGTRSIPQRTGAAAVATDAASITATGTHSEPGTFTGTGAATAGAASVNAQGTRSLPVFSGAAAPTASAPSISAAGTRGLPVFSGTAAPTAGAATSAATGTYTAPNTATGQAAVLAGPASVSAQGTRTLPVFSGLAAATAGPATSTATGIGGAASRSGLAAPTAGPARIGATARFVMPATVHELRFGKRPPTLTFGE